MCVRLKGGMAPSSSQTAVSGEKLSSSSFSVIHPFCPCQDEMVFVPNNAPFDDRIIKATGSGQSMGARHTVQMALSLTVTAQLPLWPSVQSLAQAIQAAHHPAWEKSLKMQTWPMTSVHGILTSDGGGREPDSQPYMSADYK